ncbi:glycosyltransferase family 4 protein [Cyclobacterium plantarum]|uniref:Glycosyltransferase family 4 protein n=1 Tax=Cyclobacterium plantarum TaxID=2716263 RepID=A0ABX0H3U8_9BACT|nr:glycosyltransferase family 4 protein [Cyclobacterium plantarum]NHE55553.1 glycosyltransferase family 4 protein [Cyclobacterium plantarum]
MKNIFLYPKHNKYYKSPNPYIFDFHRELAKRHKIVNKDASGLGILNLYIYFFSTEIFIFNWIETLPQKMLGRFQVAGFVLFLWFVRVFKKKVVWVLHNKGSHHQNDNKLVKKVFDLMMKRSDRIITHSESGKSFVMDAYPDQASKVMVIMHPIRELFPLLNVQKTTDFLIWGSVYKYKGIDKFLNFNSTLSLDKQFKVKIAGKCFDQKYLTEIESLVSENIEFYNEVLDFDEIYRIAQESRFILFTYNSDTVISSGSLIDSIRMGSMILGPNHGAFKDLSHLSFVNTYEDFNQIPAIIKKIDQAAYKLESERKYFYEENNWNKFIEKLDFILLKL